MKYRSRTDIITAVLHAASGGATKTKIMYGAYLSYAQIREYLDFLLAKDLLRCDEAGVYTLTENGMNLLHTFEGINQMIAVKSGSKDEGTSF